jgi:hypothetical protein
MPDKPQSSDEFAFACVALIGFLLGAFLVTILTCILSLM